MIYPGELRAEACWHLRSDENVVEGRIVPFNEPAIVVENGGVYREAFAPGSITKLMQAVRQRKNAAWIGFNFDHQEDFKNRIGYARSLEQREDGAWAEFQLYPDSDMAKIRAMLTESHTGLSVMFDDIAPAKEVDGVLWRTQVNVRHVAATPLPTYSGAVITKVRESEGLVVATPALDEWSQYLATLTP